MTIELKDKELMKKLESLSEKDPFPKALNRAYENRVNKIDDSRDIDGDSIGFLVFFGSDGIMPRFSYYVLFDDIIESWKPHEWNNYPEKQPPYNVPLMVEWERVTNEGEVYTERFCAEYFKDEDGEYWGMSDKMFRGEELSTGQEKNIRFKCWE
jgi:hypothetical protein